MIIGIIPARMDSARLPGKALRQVQGLPLIGYVIARAKRIQGLEVLILATTDRSVDDALAEYALAQGIAVYRGDLDNVALRLLNCTIEFGGDYFVRLNGDAPFVDPNLVTQGITCCQGEQPDLVTNLVGRTFPYGVVVEIVQRDAFERAYAHMTTPEEHEHVTQYLYEHPDEFSIQIITSPFPELSQAHMVVDTEVDFETFEDVAVELGETVFTADYQQVASLYLTVQRAL